MCGEVMKVCTSTVYRSHGRAGQLQGCGCGQQVTQTCSVAPVRQANASSPRLHSTVCDMHTALGTTYAHVRTLWCLLLPTHLHPHTVSPHYVHSQRVHHPHQHTPTCTSLSTTYACTSCARATRAQNPAPPHAHPACTPHTHPPAPGDLWRCCRTTASGRCRRSPVGQPRPAPAGGGAQETVIAVNCYAKCTSPYTADPFRSLGRRA